jgi:hypothetical protein
VQFRRNANSRPRGQTIHPREIHARAPVVNAPVVTKATRDPHLYEAELALQARVNRTEADPRSASTADLQAALAARIAQRDLAGADGCRARPNTHCR